MSREAWCRIAEYFYSLFPDKDGVPETHAGALIEYLAQSGYHLCSEGEGVIGGKRVRLLECSDDVGAVVNMHDHVKTIQGDYANEYSGSLVSNGRLVPIVAVIHIEETDHG